TVTALEPTTEQPSVPATAEQTTAQEETSTHEEAPTADVPPSEPIPDAPAATPSTPALALTDGAAPEAPSAFAEAIDWNVLGASPDSDSYLKVIGTVTAVTLGDAQAAAKTLYATPHIVQAPETAVSEPIAVEDTAPNQSPTTTATQPKRT